uniref:Uncharacterized protein n=1 Tax=Oryza meridionalis TaxID=40149 RepID=A0A0E0E3M0_9ORYZ
MRVSALSRRRRTPSSPWAGEWWDSHRAMAVSAASIRRASWEAETRPSVGRGARRRDKAVRRPRSPAEVDKPTVAIGGRGGGGGGPEVEDDEQTDDDRRLCYYCLMTMQTPERSNSLRTST